LVKSNLPAQPLDASRLCASRQSAVERRQEALGVLWRAQQMGRFLEAGKFSSRHERDIFRTAPMDDGNFSIARHPIQE
jgi:hypothetical protein